MIHVQQLRKRFVQGGGLPRLPGLGALGAWGAAKARVVQAATTPPEGRWNHPGWWIERLRADWPGCWRTRPRRAATA